MSNIRAQQRICNAHHTFEVWFVDMNDNNQWYEVRPKGGGNVVFKTPSYRKDEPTNPGGSQCTAWLQGFDFGVTPEAFSLVCGVN